MSEAAVSGDLFSLALVGNPNCGKTALFNALTGSRQKVANYPGVTVERKAGHFTTPEGRHVQILDLPGSYSLRARSPDEEVTRDFILGRMPGEKIPDLILCVADSTNLRLAIRLALELKQIGRPMLLVLNMFDIARKRGIEIDMEKLSNALGVPVVTSVAVRRAGTEELLKRIDTFATQPRISGQIDWTAPSASEIRDLQRETDRILRAVVPKIIPPDTLTAKFDAVLLHPVAGLAILLVLLLLMFQAVFTWAQPAMVGIENVVGWISGLIGGAMPDGLLKSLINDGIIAGVGSVIVFLPQILILFFFILILEDLGYMARAAFLMDRIMGGAGLHGRAFIPLLSSFACAIPGIMSTRVIDNRKDRLTTILVAPLMTCSARIPVYTLIIGAFIPNREVWGWANLQGLVMFGLYATGIVSALVVSFVIKHVFWRNAITEPFMLELPDYKIPNPKNVALGLWTRAKAFLTRAGTIILMLMIVVWVLSTFPYPPPGATGPAIDYSFAAMIGHALEPILSPIGFNWQMNIALVPGMAAREVAVAALGTVYAVSGEASASDIGSVLAAQWSLATALAFLAWYVFAPQCVATLGVIKRETGGWTWMWVVVVYMFALAYIAAFATYHIAVALGAG